MTVDIEDRIRGALQEVAEHVDYGDDGVIELVPRRRRGPARALAVAGLVAAAAAGVALVVGTTSSHHSSPASVSIASSTTEGATTAPTTTDPKAAGALATWADFPVGAQPRPIVLTGDDTRGPDGGFTNPDIAIADAQKEALAAGSISPPASFPSAPGSAGGFPIVGASDAFDRLRAEGTGTATMTLETTAVRLGTSAFLTDRGWRSLPAWLFSFRDVQGPVIVLAVAPSARFTSPNANAAPTQLGASTKAGTRTVELTFVGSAAGTGPCQAEYEGHVTESHTAVAVSVTRLPNPAAEQTTTSGSTIIGCTLEGHSRHVTITLRAPLGARVLVDDERNSAVPTDVLP